MLAVKHYEQDHIDHCRARLDAQLAAYDDVRAAAGDGAAIDAFGPLFFNNLVLVLDAYFMHRERALERKDGNPMNEVRLLSKSLLANGGELVADRQIKLKPDASVLGLAIGDEISLGEDDFRRLATAYFAEIERAYG